MVKNTFLEVNRQLQIEDLTRDLSRARPRPRTRENHRPLEMQITPGDHRAPFVLRGWNVPPGRVGVGVGEREPLCPQGREGKARNPRQRPRELNTKPGPLPEKLCCKFYNFPSFVIVYVILCLLAEDRSDWT